MSILDLGTVPSRPSVGKKSTRIFLGFGLLAAVIGIGSTFASTISINANQDIEFGQGVERTVFCGGERSITVTPTSTFANSDDLGTFGLTSITVSDIPKECSDRNFIIKVYDNNGGSEPLILSKIGNGSNDAKMSIANVWWASGCPDENESTCRLDDYVTEEGFALVSTQLDSYIFPDELVRIDVDSPNAFTINFLRNPLSSNSVKKIVIETQNDTYGFAEYADEYEGDNEPT
jgi:hypothetical protein